MKNIKLHALRDMTIALFLTFIVGEKAFAEGFIDSIDVSSGIVSGWAVSTSDPAVSIDVQFFVDCSVSNSYYGTYIGSTSTSVFRPDVNSYFKAQNIFVAGNHGYSFQIPAEFRNGKRHTLCASAWQNMLTNSGRLFYLTPNPQSNTSTYYSLAAGTSNDAIWPAASATDGNYGSVYSSNYFPSSENNRGTFLAAWIPGGQKSISSVNLTARTDQNRKALGFAKNYDIYLTSPDNSRWDYVGNYNAQVDSGGFAKINLGFTIQTSGVLIVPHNLGVDDNGNHYFQLAEIGLTGP